MMEILRFTLLSSHFSVRVQVRFEVHGSRFTVRRSRFDVHGSRHQKLRSQGPNLNANLNLNTNREARSEKCEHRSRLHAGQVMSELVLLRLEVLPGVLADGHLERDRFGYR